MNLVLLRFNSQYSDIVHKILEDSSIADYVESSDVTFSEHKSKKQSIRPWPEANTIAIKAMDETTSKILLDKIKKYKKEHNLTHQIKIFMVPIEAWG